MVTAPLVEIVNQIGSLLELTDEPVDGIVELLERPSSFINLVTTCDEVNAATGTIKLQIFVEPTQSLLDLVVALRAGQ